MGHSSFAPSNEIDSYEKRRQSSRASSGPALCHNSRSSFPSEILPCLIPSNPVNKSTQPWLKYILFQPTMPDDQSNSDCTWNCLGIASSTVGLVCYALSSSFIQLYGEWNPLKSIIYAVVSLGISLIMLFPNKLKVTRISVKESHVIILALVFTSWYSAYCDKNLKGNPDALSVISTAAFTIMSRSLSAQVKLEYQVGVSTFFLGVLTVQLIKVRLILACVAVVFYYFDLFLFSTENSQERRRNQEARRAESAAVEQQETTETEQQTEQQESIEAGQQSEQQESTEARQQESTDPVAEQDKCVTLQLISQKTKKNKTETKAGQQESTNPVAEPNMSVTLQPISEKTKRNKTATEAEQQESNEAEQQESTVAGQQESTDAIAEQTKCVTLQPITQKTRRNKTATEAGQRESTDPVAEPSMSVTLQPITEKTKKNKTATEAEQQESNEAKQQIERQESIGAAQQESTDATAEQNKCVTLQPITQKTKRNKTVLPPETTGLRVEQQVEKQLFTNPIAGQNESVTPTIEKTEKQGTCFFEIELGASFKGEVNHVDVLRATKHLEKVYIGSATLKGM